MAEEVQNIYDEIEIDDMDFEDDKFYYPCPCGDKFQINIVRHYLINRSRSKSWLGKTSPRVPAARSRSKSFSTMSISRISSKTEALSPSSRPAELLL